jgi:hypothetical protein
MKIEEILEWVLSVFTGAMLLFASLGLFILGKIGISVLAPMVNSVLADGSSITWQYIALYWFMVFAGAALFVSSFIVFFRMVRKLV